MLRLLSDEDFNGRIVRGLRLRQSDLDIVRVQEVGLSGAPDPIVLEWAATEGRLVLTHDVSTMTKHAYARVSNNQPMPGIIEADQDIPIGQVIDDVLLLVNCSFEEEWEGQVIHLPLR
jgi:predicted nuclease of predicted toxin-antitoxin system